MAKQLSTSGILTGDTIEPGHITQSIDALTGVDAYELKISGSLQLTGSLDMPSGSSMQGTASYSEYSLSGSHALTASYALFSAGGGAGNPDGPDKSVQFRDGNSFKGVSNFNYDQSTDTLSAGTGNFTTIIGSVSADSLRTPALIDGSPSTRANASSSIDPDGFARFVSASIAGFTINTNEIKSSGDLLRLKASGEITASGGFLFGNKNALPPQYIQYDGSSLVVRGDLSVDQLFLPALINGAPSDVTNASSSLLSNGFARFVSASIGGWDISTDAIESTSMIMRPQGLLQTKNFASGQSGWRISAEGNGTAEFENARIRGTLRTTTFEKESVNAVGGQLWVVNSTTISQSVSETATTMSVANASGFSQGEILMAKKVDNTGFSTEYILVNSASIDGDGSGDNQTFGRIMVTRAYGQGQQGDFVGDIASTSQSYSDGQVLVSTAKSGSGFIKLNANPNDVETPFMDITERTGSGIYDVELKARLGDLSGLANSDYVFNRPNPGFGLATDNVFLQGGIKATFGEIGGFNINNNLISSSNQNLIMRSDGTLSASGGFLFGSKSTAQYVEYDGSSLVVRGDLSVDNIKTPATIAGNPSTFTNASSSIDSQGFARFVSASIGGFEVNTEQIKASNNQLVLSSSGEFLAGDKSSNQYVEYDGTNLVVRGDLSVDSISTPALIGGSPSTPANASSSISADGFASFKSASIAGFIVNTSEIKSSNNLLRLKADGNITASNVLLGDKSGGNFLQFDGSTLTVQGSITADQISTPSNLSGADVSSSISPDGFASFKSASIGGFEITPDFIRSGFTPASSSINVTNTPVSASFRVARSKVEPTFFGQTATLTNLAFNASSTSFYGNYYIKSTNNNNNLFLTSNGGDQTNIAPIGELTSTEIELGNTYVFNDAYWTGNQSQTADFTVYFNPGASISVSNSSSSETINYPATESIILDSANNRISIIDGEITASKGLIGGTVINGTSLESTNEISPTPTAGSGGKAFKLEDSGTISGSNMYIRQALSLNGNTTIVYPLIDTRIGLLDGRNLGRQIVSDYTLYTRQNVDDGFNFTTIGEHFFQLLPYENSIVINCNTKTNAQSGTQAAGQLQFQCFVGAETGSYENDTYWDVYNAMSPANGATVSNVVNTTNANRTKTIFSTGADALTIAIPEAYQAKAFKLVVKFKMDRAGVSSGQCSFQVKGYTATATRALTAATSGNPLPSIPEVAI